MKEKIYKKVQFYGKLTTITNQEYWLLAPLPVPGDNWQLEHQQSWYVVPFDPYTSRHINDKDFWAYLEPRHIVTSFPTIDPYLRDGWVWTGEYYDDVAAEAQDNRDVEEPSVEDLEWYSKHLSAQAMSDMEIIMNEVAND